MSKHEGPDWLPEGARLITTPLKWDTAPKEHIERVRKMEDQRLEGCIKAARSPLIVD